MNNPENLPTGVLQVLFTAAEADPLIKIGGLGDVAGSLPAALRSLDPSQTGGNLIDARVVIPFHGAISIGPEECTAVGSFSVPSHDGPVEARAFYTEANGIPYYLIAGDPIPPEAPVYSLETEKDGEKYAFFSRAVLELARIMKWKPDILHANDWHTAAAVFALNQVRTRDSFFADTRSILTLHNVPFMGAGTSAALTAYDLPPSDDLDLPPWARHYPLPMGLSKADQIVAVSPAYASEILTPEFGCGLEGFFRARSERLTGILNGLQQDIWDPATDSSLPSRYSSQDLAARVENKSALLHEFGLQLDLNIPLLILISRMDQQKGVDLAIAALRKIIDIPWQAVLLGTGDPALETACRRLEADFPERVRAAIRFDSRLSRRMYAGADVLMMPSRYEPCGLAQMIAMRYGCIPVARAVGGLRDTIKDLPRPEQSTGFLFEDATPEALAEALKRTLAAYDTQETWQLRQRSGMLQDFSWERSAAAYAALYQVRRMQA